MRIEARLFELLTGLFILATIVYGVLTKVFSHHLEWAGTTALALTAGLTLIIGTFFRFISRRVDIRPEDYENADIADGAGELGFFPPHSWWPILISASFSTAAIGAALWLPWLIFAGICFVLASVCGLVFEYYIGPEKH
jgi:hypothetical protein